MQRLSLVSVNQKPSTTLHQYKGCILTVAKIKAKHEQKEKKRKVKMI